MQGDERDAIIISVGYGKHPDGRMRYQWGPLLRDGGERRLNVAATRARRRLTVVSSFSSHDVDPSRLTAPGARMLAEYLEYARAGGVPVAGYAASAGQPPEGSAGRYAKDGPGDAGRVPRQRGRQARGARHHGRPAVRRRRLRGRLRRRAPGRPVPDDPRYRGRQRRLPRLRAACTTGPAHRKEHLERLGWHVHRLWSTAWFTDPGGELARLRAAFDSAVSATPPPPAAEPRDEPVAQAAPAAARPEPGPDPQASPRPEAPPQPAEASWPDAPPGFEDEPWPQETDRAWPVRVIPLGPGERPQLSAAAARALPRPGQDGPRRAAAQPGTGPARSRPARNRAPADRLHSFNLLAAAARARLVTKARQQAGD